MRTFAWFSGIVIAAVLALPLPAQSLRVTATIPFEFSVGSDRMPAGEYTLESGGLPGALHITKSDQRAYTFALGQPLEAQAGSASGESKLVFHRYGNEYFLREIRGTVTNRLAGSIEERRLARTRTVGLEKVAIQASPM